MFQRHSILALALFGALWWGGPHARAQDVEARGSAREQESALAGRLDELIQKAGLGDGIGIVVAEARSGRRLYTLRPETPRNPASNMKLITAATALHELGASFRLRTTLAGSIAEDGGVETLVLRGEGDPSLNFGDLLSMSRRLSELGVRRVDKIVVDGSYFDDHLLPPAFDQQPNEIAAFRAAVGAVSVDRNAFELRVAPGPAVDAPANVILRCPDYFAVESSLTTSASGSPHVIAEQRARGDTLSLRISGSVPMGIRGVGYERRIESPLPYAGACLKAALKSQRIAGTMQVSVGAPPAGLPVLVGHESETLAELLDPVGKNSDNFYAEMLLKVIGAHAQHRPGSSAGGAERAQALLERAGVARGAVKMLNGSGLFKGGAVAPDHLVKVLLYMYADPAVRSEYIAHLAVAGVDGTLHSRMENLPKRGVVRAKTGTLDDAISLSGYVLGKTAEHDLVFSFLMNGIAGKQWLARALADDLVRALVASIWTK
jgi:D-alanyl-D-alanine carboxypeptidase/D-alanyl-D-alanine-endopeptidase (penicillin-binding protein 4)